MECYTKSLLSFLPLLVDGVSGASKQLRLLAKRKERAGSRVEILTALFPFLFTAFLCSLVWKSSQFCIVCFFSDPWRSSGLCPGCQAAGCCRFGFLVLTFARTAEPAGMDLFCIFCSAAICSQQFYIINAFCMV